MGRRLLFEANSPIPQPALSLPFLAILATMTISIISVLCGARSRKSSAGKSTPPPLSSSPSPKTTKVTHVKKPTPPPPLILEKSTHEPEEPELPPTPKSSDTTTSSTSSCDQSFVPPLSASTSKGRLMKSISLKLHKGLLRVRTDKEDEQQRKQRQQQEQQEQEQQQIILFQNEDKDSEEPKECLWKKSIILGERCKVPDDEEDAFFDDEKGNKVMAYTPRTPRTPRTARPLESRTSNYFDVESE